MIGTHRTNSDVQCKTQKLGADWITGAEIRERTGWNAQQLRRRIADGKFPAKIDFDRWNRADVESHLSRKTSNEGWTVNEKAIRLAVAGYVRRAEESARLGRQRGNVAHSLRGAETPPPRRVASRNRTPAR